MFFRFEKWKSQQTEANSFVILYFREPSTDTERILFMLL